MAQAIQGATRGTPGTVAKVQAAARELEQAASTPAKGRQDGVTAVRIEGPTFKWSDWLWQGSYGAIELIGQMIAFLCLVFYLLVSAICTGESSCASCPPCRTRR